MADATHCLDKLLDSAGEEGEATAVPHVAINNIGKHYWPVLEAKWRQLGSRLNPRTAKVVFSEMPPVLPRAS